MPEQTGTPNLVEMLSWRRPHGTVTDDEFVALYLDSVPGMRHDDFGNRMLSVGDNPVIAYLSHTDTVHQTEGRQQVHVSPDGILRGDGNECLGADDTTGVWIMLEMIRHECPGLYIFHRGEECGCLGSAWIAKETPELLDGIKAAMSFDRRGYDSVVTHQAGQRTASDEWAGDVAGLLDLGMFPDDTGVFTDSLEYAHLIPECTNLSVGYTGQHGAREKQDYPWALALLKALVRNAEAFAQLPVHRDHTLPAYRSWKAYDSGRDGTWGDYWKDHLDPDWDSTEGTQALSDHGDHLYTMYLAVKDNPGLAAQYLIDAGFDPSDLED